MPYVTVKRTNLVLHLLTEKHDIEWCHKYGEPGYSDPHLCIVFGNWNRIPQRLQEYLEAAGAELEWSDEWMIDYETGKAYRTTGNSYHWTPSVMWYEENHRWLTPDNPVADWVEAVKHTKDTATKKALPHWITRQMLLDEGFQLEGEYEYSMHYNSDVDPRKIAERILSGGASEVVFHLGAVAPFETDFSAFYR